MSPDFTPLDEGSQDSISYLTAQSQLLYDRGTDFNSLPAQWEWVALIIGMVAFLMAVSPYIGQTKARHCIQCKDCVHYTSTSRGVNTKDLFRLSSGKGISQSLVLLLGS